MGLQTGTPLLAFKPIFEDSRLIIKTIKATFYLNINCHSAVSSVLEPTIKTEGALLFCFVLIGWHSSSSVPWTLKLLLGLLFYTTLNWDLDAFLALLLLLPEAVVLCGSGFGVSCRILARAIWLGWLVCWVPSSTMLMFVGPSASDCSIAKLINTCVMGEYERVLWVIYILGRGFKWACMHKAAKWCTSICPSTIHIVFLHSSIL